MRMSNPLQAQLQTYAQTEAQSHSQEQTHAHAHKTTHRHIRYSSIFLSIPLLILIALPAVGQTTREEIYADIARAAGCYYAYPYSETEYTPAPKGYKPFYISHYGRHGSRYLLSSWDYIAPIRTLERADSAGVLSDKGKEVLSIIREEGSNAEGRYGELTPLGAQQHKEIAQRMYEHYPKVFAKNGKIDARATIVIRCILSMQSFCQSLLANEPTLQITNEASQHDMYYMNYEFLDRWPLVERPEWQEPYWSLYREHIKPERLISTLITDEEYASHMHGQPLMWQLMWIAGDMQNTPGEGSLTDLFTDEEWFDYWIVNNANWYGFSGSAPQTMGRQPLQAVNLLRDITEKANEAIEGGEVCATLRFGHDECLLPLATFIHIEGTYCEVEDLDELYKYFADYKIIPMACNLQMIFYRSKRSDDILVKFLLNEKETRLTEVESDLFPYYHWSDVADYFETKINIEQ